MVGGVCLKAWSTTQGVVALSSGEAEYYAAVKGASEGLGFQAACQDLGTGPMTVNTLTDSSACKGICQRTGLGKIRHIDVALLWLQDLVRKGRVVMKKIPGVKYPADLLTKYLAGAKISKMTEELGFYVEQGRTQIVDEERGPCRMSHLIQLQVSVVGPVASMEVTSVQFAACCRGVVSGRLHTVEQSRGSSAHALLVCSFRRSGWPGPRRLGAGSASSRGGVRAGMPLLGL